MQCYLFQWLKVSWCRGLFNENRLLRELFHTMTIEGSGQHDPSTRKETLNLDYPLSLVT